MRNNGLLALAVNRFSFAGYHDGAGNGFHRHERVTAVDVGALVVALLGIFRQVAAGTGMSGMTAQRTMHHFEITLCVRVS